MAHARAATLVEVLAGRAAQHPERDALAFAPNARSGEVRDQLTYRQLHEQACTIASELRRLGYRAGQRALLIFPAGLDFARAFFGCIYAGLVAVPAPPPEGSRASVERVEAVLADARAALIITDDATLPGVGEWLGGRAGSSAGGSDRAGVPCRTVRSLGGADAVMCAPHPVTAGDLALLQYTSGSTSEPKGVMITHGNLVSNLDLASTLLGHQRAKGCGWLPLTHDMGLIGQLLFTIYTGGWCLLLPPLEFAKRPHRWLELMAACGAQQAIAPNFAYELCARTVSDELIASLDLSQWTVAINGAEPIDIKTLEAFAKKFAPAGFRPEAFMACYGLAEATLFVSGTPRDQPPTVTLVDSGELARGRFAPAGDGRPGRPLVSSGTFAADSVLIVDPQTRVPLRDREVGEIWVTGPGVGRGYWGRQGLTDLVFRARTADGRPGYLRTGDLGVVDNRELYVTGRLKDVIITRGRNLYPQDLEHAVRGQSGDLRFGSTAVFALDNDEDIVVVQELQRRPRDEHDLGAVASCVKRELAEHWGSGRISVVFVRPGTISKTTSGKIRRSETRRLFLESGLNHIYASLAPGVSGRLKERT
jgi:acyl-CoA synthetase (AMP-forming)/AMP-acid ligase II